MATVVTKCSPTLPRSPSLPWQTTAALTLACLVSLASAGAFAAETLTVGDKSVSYWRATQESPLAEFQFEAKGYRNRYTLDCAKRQFLWTQNVRISTGRETGNNAGAEWKPLNSDSRIANAVYELICPGILGMAKTTETKSLVSLFESCRNDDSACTSELVSQMLRAGADPNEAGQNSARPLQRAIQNGLSNDVLQALIRAGADVNGTDAGGHTALMAVVEQGLGTPERLRILIDAGANVNVQDENGLTALMTVARAATSVESARELLNAGADPNIKVPDTARRTPGILAGDTALDFASRTLEAIRAYHASSPAKTAELKVAGERVEQAAAEIVDLIRKWTSVSATVAGQSNATGIAQQDLSADGMLKTDAMDQKETPGRHSERSEAGQDVQTIQGAVLEVAHPRAGGIVRIRSAGTRYSFYLETNGDQGRDEWERVLNTLKPGDRIAIDYKGDLYDGTDYTQGGALRARRLPLDGVGALEPAEPYEQRDKISIRDGSVLKGAIRAGKIPFASSFGPVEVDLSEVGSFADGALYLRDGTVLKGRFGEAMIEIATARGNSKIPASQVVNIARSSVEAEASAAGVAQSRVKDGDISSTAREAATSPGLANGAGALSRERASTMIKERIIQGGSLPKYKVDVTDWFVDSSTKSPEECFADHAQASLIRWQSDSGLPNIMTAVRQGYFDIALQPAEKRPGTLCLGCDPRCILQLLPKVQEYVQSIEEYRGSTGGQRVALAVYNGVDIAVTGMTQPSSIDGRRVMIAEFTYTLTLNPLGKALSKSGDSPSRQGRAAFVLYDDGWRVEAVQLEKVDT